MGIEPVVPQPPFDKVRRWPRYKLDIPVRVVATKGDKVKIVQGRGNELNEGGLSIFAGIELKVQDQVAIEFTPPYSGTPIRARCTVRDRSDYKYGVEFLMETDEDFMNASRIKAVLQGFGTPVQ